MQYEVEIKCLISEQQATELPDRIRKFGISVEQHAQYQQLNDYFVDGDLRRLAKHLRLLLGEAKSRELAEIAQQYDAFSVRARQSGDKVVFMAKAAKGASANHSPQRREFEVSVDVPLDELSKQIAASSYKIQARWMAERTLYKLSNGLTLDIYFSPGYGYQVEFEKIVQSEDELVAAEAAVRQFAQRLRLTPVSPARIERMFDYYNAHWPEYYGTRKTFELE